MPALSAVKLNVFTLSVAVFYVMLMVNMMVVAKWKNIQPIILKSRVRNQLLQSLGQNNDINYIFEQFDYKLLEI
jgi:hypothetical protein